jgi:serine/threonine protein kinase
MIKEMSNGQITAVVMKMTMLADLGMRYWAPELRTGSYSTSADIWSFGIMLYELMTLARTTLPRGITDEQTEKKVHHTMRVKMESMQVYDDGLIDSVLHMLRYDPLLRIGWKKRHRTFRIGTDSISSLGDSIVFKPLNEDAKEYKVIHRTGRSKVVVEDLCLNEFGEKVAVKRIKVEKSKDLLDPKNTIDAIMQGIELIRQHSIPAICEVRDCYYVKKSDKKHLIYMIMQYHEYGDLSEYIKYLQKPIPQNTIIHILKQLVIALSWLHSRNIVHRDIKVSLFIRMLTISRQIFC